MQGPAGILGWGLAGIYEGKERGEEGETSEEGASLVSRQTLGDQTGQDIWEEGCESETWPENESVANAGTGGM